MSDTPNSDSATYACLRCGHEFEVDKWLHARERGKELVHCLLCDSTEAEESPDL